MKKRVNVYCNTPFVIGPAAFAGACENIVLEVNNIGTCIMNKAKVVEILADGTLVPLDFTNFDKDNGKSDVTENDVPITDKRKHSRPVIEVVDAVKEVKPTEVVTTATTKEEAVVESGAMLYHGVTLGGTGKDVGKRHPTVRRGALISAHAQVIGPVEIGENAKVGAAAVVVSDVPSDVTVVGIPAKVVRVHGKKDKDAIHQIEEERESKYYTSKLDQLRHESLHSSNL